MRAVHDWDHRTVPHSLDWRLKLDNQRGAVQALEIKNNGFKMARWTLGAMLANAAWIKLGFVSRVQSKVNTKHSVLGVLSSKPNDLVQAMGLTVSNAWGILRVIVDHLRVLEDGKYVIFKDPSKVCVCCALHMCACRRRAC